MQKPVCFRIVLASLLSFVVRSGFANQFENDFDGPETSWQVRCRGHEAKLDTHVRCREGARRGRSEYVCLQVARENTPVRLEHQVPATRVLVDELTASLWVHSNRPGITLALRISFRNTVDPATGKPMNIIVDGDRYDSNELEKWQQLKCRASEKAVNDKLRLFRATHKVSVDVASMYVDQVILGCQFAPGLVEMLIDDLELGPVIPVDDIPPKLAAAGKSAAPIRDVAVVPAGITEEQIAPSVPVEFRLHKMRVEKRPFFPRMVPYRQERPDVLGNAGFNVVWIPELESVTNIGQFRERGIWLTSTPPYAKGASGEPLDSDDASLMPFNASTSSVLFWTLGARMSSESRPTLSSWASQVRDADKNNKRALAADVVDNERIASRHLDIVGFSQHVLNSTLSLGDYRNEIIRRRDRAWPGTFCFSWVQTEPAPELMELSQLTDEPPVLEPEQIRLQVYAALAAGCRGIGFWTTTPLDADAPGARERLLTITLLNLELALLEPWLATGSGVQLIPFTVDTNQPPPKARPVPLPPNGKKTAEMIEAERCKEREFSAALIRHENGSLLLPMWLEDRSQFVPAQLAAYSATIIVPGAGETATAWEITTTGRVQPLNREPVAGGVKIVVKNFDQTAAILLTSDLSIRERIDPRITAIQEQSATAAVELCRLKLDRVRKVDNKLNQMGIHQPRGSQWLGEAKLNYDKAESALRQQQYDSARRLATSAMQSARILQRAHWDEAVAKLSSPVVSPFAVCFQTLPAHWKLSRFCAPTESKVDPNGDSPLENRLPSGDFEDPDTMIAEHWEHDQRSYSDIQSSVEFYPMARHGKLALRFLVQPTVPNPTEFDFHFPPEKVVTPAIAAHAGELVKISGWVKTPQSILKSRNGALIYDSVLGKGGGIRIVNSPEWQRFELWRPIVESKPLTLNVEMRGLGEFLIDDLRITTVPLPVDLADTAKVGDPIRPVQHSPLERFGLRPLSPGRRRQ